MRNTHTSLLLSLSLAACASSHPTSSPSEPSLTIASTGFYVDGDRWLTATSGPLLTGKAQAGAGARVSVVVAGKQIGAPVPVVDGGWAMPLPAGTIDASDTTVEVDLLGTQTTATQVIVLDDSVPAVATATTSIRDERADRVDFATGVPMHDHAGGTIALGGSGCPDVYLYPYLHGEAAPQYGGELAPNPLVFAFRGMAPYALDGAARYRVTAGDGSTVLDWIAAPAIAADGSLAITIHRDGVRAVPLDALTGAVVVEVEYADWDGRTTTASACWTNHPLAAPLQIVAPPSPGTLAGLALGNGSPVSRVIEFAGSAPSVYEMTIVQTTAEPIVVDIAFAPPAMTFQQTSVVRSIHPASAGGAIGCGNGCASGSRSCTQHPATDARCNLSPVVLETVTPTSGALTSGAWWQSFVDSNLSSPCTTTSPTEVRCTIPPRALGAPPVQYSLTQSLTGAADLKVFAGTYAEQSVFGYTFTGVAPWAFSHCDNLMTAAPDTNGAEAITCFAWTTYTGIAGIASAHVDFAATSLTIAAGTNAATLAPINYASIAIPAVSWDAGADNLL